MSHFRATVYGVFAIIASFSAVLLFLHWEGKLIEVANRPGFLWALLGTIGFWFMFMWIEYLAQDDVTGGYR